jgi:hypothetical protein
VSRTQKHEHKLIRGSSADTVLQADSADGVALEFVRRGLVVTPNTSAPLGTLFEGAILLGCMDNPAHSHCPFLQALPRDHVKSLGCVLQAGVLGRLLLWGDKSRTAEVGPSSNPASALQIVSGSHAKRLLLVLSESALDCWQVCRLGPSETSAFLCMSLRFRMAIRSDLGRSH